MIAKLLFMLFMLLQAQGDGRFICRNGGCRVDDSGRLPPAALYVPPAP